MAGTWSLERSSWYGWHEPAHYAGAWSWQSGDEALPLRAGEPKEAWRDRWSPADSWARGWWASGEGTAWKERDWSWPSGQSEQTSTSERPLRWQDYNSNGASRSSSSYDWRNESAGSGSSSQRAKSQGFSDQHAAVAKLVDIVGVLIGQANLTATASLPLRGSRRQSLPRRSFQCPAAEEVQRPRGEKEQVPLLSRDVKMPSGSGEMDSQRSRSSAPRGLHSDAWDGCQEIWDWPLSRAEMKARVQMIERHLHRMEIEELKK